MLCHGYGPVLFRALDYPNDHCRRNALRIFSRAFPIRDPEHTRPEASKRVEEQFSKLLSFLHDKNAAIRADAVEGVCGALQQHWTLLGSSLAIPALDTVFNEMAHDSSNKTVRLSVLKGVEILLEHHLIHQHIKGLLPSLKDCLGDVSSIVRLAFVRLLKNVARIPRIMFWEVRTPPIPPRPIPTAIPILMPILSPIPIPSPPPTQECIRREGGPHRPPQKRLDRRLEEVAKAGGGGYCRLQMRLKLAL